jgi:hypothetical protein
MEGNPLPVLKPLCVTCVRQYRSPGSMRCETCAPKRIAVNANPQPAGTAGTTEGK